MTGTGAGEGQVGRPRRGEAAQVEAGGHGVATPPPLPPPPCQLGHIPKVGKVEARNNGEAEAAGEFLQ